MAGYYDNAPALSPRLSAPLVVGLVSGDLASHSAGDYLTGAMKYGHLAVWLCVAALCGCEPEPSKAAETHSSPTATPTATATATATSSPVVATAASAAPASSGPPTQRPVRVAFAGDVALALKVGIHLEMMAQGLKVPAGIGPGYPFTNIAERLRAADLLVGNLECVVSLLGDRDTNHNPFRCPLVAIDVLKDAGFDLMSVANNHVKDFGPRGFRDTLKRLDAANLPHFGKETFTPGRPQAPVIRELGGMKVGLLAYYYPPKRPLTDIETARSQVDVLMVFMHWGREDQPEPLEMQRQLARHCIDAGVDLVVGTHAHVMQPTEWYKGKLIAYGLGNFVFSGMTHTELHRTGALLEVDLAEGRIVSHRMLKIRLDIDGAPHWTQDPDTVAAEKPSQ